MQQLTLDELESIGFVLKTHGYQGHIKVSLQLEEAKDIQTEWVMILIDQKPVPFFIVEQSANNKEWLLKLEDVDTDFQAKKLVGKPAYVLRSILPELKSQIPTLNGYTLIDDQEGKIGIIDREFESGGQQFIGLVYQGKEVLIPFVDAIIYAIDQNQQEVYSRIPEGLLQINS